jgi:hypothetical protein
MRVIFTIPDIVFVCCLMSGACKEGDIHHTRYCISPKLHNVNFGEQSLLRGYVYLSKGSPVCLYSCASKNSSKPSIMFIFSNTEITL